MAKYAGTWAAVTGGVSEQVPQQRRSGQHGLQDNFVSDPVRGMARRHGSILLAQSVVRAVTTNMAATLSDLQHHNTYRFSDTSGNFYDLLYRTQASLSVASESAANFAFCYDYTNKAYLPVQLDTSDALVSAAVSGGVGAIAAVGRYVLMAAKTATTSYTTSNPYGGDNQKRLAVWIRSGAYARTYSITVTKADGTLVTVSYKTKQSSYPELLDTSGISLYLLDSSGNPIKDNGASSSAGTTIYVSDPQYTKHVNDVVNAYNSAATAWIGEAAQDIVPSNIATQLSSLLVAQGIASSVIDSTVIIDVGANCIEVDSDDGGDETSVHHVGNVITDPSLISAVHYVGKVVKVTPASGTDLQEATSSASFYLKAVPADGVSTGWTSVNWEETAGYVTQPTEVFLLGTVANGTMYIAGSPAKLASMTGLTDVPTFQPNLVGDAGTAPKPTFLGSVVTYLGMFQDRLLVGTGSTMFMSRPGDYFNWFRKSVLAVNDADPIEIQAAGAENDTIRYSVTYDRDPFFFGDLQQYGMSGDTIATPKTSVMTIVSAHSNATEARPLASGNYVMYCKRRDSLHSSLHQVQVGVLTTAPDSYEVSNDLVEYLKGTPVELATLESPNYVFLRTTNQQALYTYTFLDTPPTEQRVMDAWSRWTWDSSLGSIVGLQTMEGFPICHMLAETPDGIVIRALQFSIESRLSDYPYLDMLVPATADTDGAGLSVAWGQNGSYPFVGADVSTFATDLAVDGSVDYTDLWSGYTYDSVCEITNPFVRDSNGQALTNGRLTLSWLGVSMASSGGLVSSVTTNNGTSKVVNWGGYFLAQSQALLNQQPVIDTRITVGVGRETRECTVTLASQLWLPLNIIALDWTGQLFNRVRRA